MMGYGNKWSLSVFCALWCLAGGYETPHGLNLVCPPGAGDRCQQISYSYDDHFYNINGFSETITFQEGKHFLMSCFNTPLNDSALPQFPRLVNFKMVKLKHCAPPGASGSYVGALARLNVSILDKLVLDLVPAGTRLTRAALADLPSAVTALDISATGHADLEPDALVASDQLRKLWLTKVRPDKLPPNLTLLNLRYTGLTTLPELPDDLEVLNILENSLEDVAPLSKLNNLRELHLSAPLEEVPPLPGGLVNLTLAQVRERAATALPQCGKLRRLMVQGGAARPPPGWVAACPRLRYLDLQFQYDLTHLPDDLLRGATDLQELHIKWGGLKTLPKDLFKYSTNLKVLNLSNNKLETLPSDVFSPLAGSLESLDLSHNLLRARDVCDALNPLLSLTTLSLAHNHLGDLCDAEQDSRDFYTSVDSCLRRPMRESLRKLSLSDTNATRVCADWLRETPALRRLDLTNNHIAILSLTELNSMKRDEPSELDLSGNPLISVEASAEDHRLAGVDHSQSKVTVLLRSEFTCDCTLYWFTRALREGRVAVGIEPVCAGGTPVRRMDPKLLECALEASLCAPCACAAVPALGGLRVTCARAPPAALLRAPPQPIRDLRLAGAGLDRLPDPMPSGLFYLDLANNSISGASAREGAALGGALRLRLAHNPLACDCSPRSLLPLLRARTSQLMDLNETRCADGRLLTDVKEECGGGVAGLTGALAALGAAAAAAGVLAALLARAEPRLRIKAWLHARGVRGRWVSRAGPADAARLFDAFLSHAPQDARFVATQLAPKLQKKGYKLCLKDRDWPPGAWIPSQIEASVASSRRTIAVVSAPAPAPASASAPAPAAGDGWAEAELRAAHAASLREKRSRLIIVLLGAPPPALKEIARSHVRLRWGEPCFWEKLLYALPDPITKLKTLP